MTNYKSLKSLIATCDADIPANLIQLQLRMGDKKSFLRGGSQVWNGIGKGFLRDPTGVESRLAAGGKFYDSDGVCHVHFSVPCT